MGDFNDYEVFWAKAVYYKPKPMGFYTNSDIELVICGKFILQIMLFFLENLSFFIDTFAPSSPRSSHPCNVTHHKK